MTTSQFVMPETDVEGFLVDPTEWTEEVAEHIAHQENVTLTDAHWEVINFMREHFEEHHVPPDSRLMVLVLGERYGKDMGTRKYLYELFPYGYTQQACKVAGMRRPRAWSTG